MEGLDRRLKDLAADMPRGWQAELARKCGIKPPSVNAWLSGDTKRMDAAHLFAAADFFGVNAKWLGFGVGPKTHREAPGTVIQMQPPDSLAEALRVLSDSLSAANKQTRETAAAMLAGYARDPQASNIADALAVLLGTRFAPDSGKRNVG